MGHSVHEADLSIDCIATQTCSFNKRTTTTKILRSANVCHDISRV